MPLRKGQLETNATHWIREEIRNDNSLNNLADKYNAWDIKAPNARFINLLPGGFEEVVDVQLRPIGRGGGYDVYLVRNDGGGGQDYGSTHVGTIH